MKPITFNQQTYLLDGKPVYLLSGEFHYFRVPKSDWRKRMQLFKEAGGNVLATYIPWLIHEPEEGQYRFSGEDWLDLEGFLQTARQEGLYVIARPGPYQYSELMYDGLPGWLLHKYPEILARTIEDKPFRESSVSYLHPVFLEKVRNWFDQVCPILAHYTLEEGGPIAFVQLDNEMVGIHEWFGTLDYNSTTMGFGNQAGRYAQFLQQRYSLIQNLNQAYSTNYTDFSVVHPNHPNEDPIARFRKRKDYYDFYTSAIAEYSTTLAQMIRNAGITLPLVHNSGNPGMNAHFLETIQALGGEYLLGSDHYYNLDQEWPQNNPTPQYAARVLVSLEMLRLMGFPPTVYEIPGGSLSDWPPITPGDALAAYMANLAFGMKGSNYYIFTGGPNPPGVGNTSDVYDYGAGISAYGEIRPLYHAQKEFGNFIQSRPWLTTASRVSDIHLALDFEQPRSSYYWTENLPAHFGQSEAWNFLRRGPLTSALCAGLSPSFVNLDADGWTHDISIPLVVAASSSMSALKQRRLVNFIQSGGQVLVTSVLPFTDENLNPCTILQDFLGTSWRGDTAKTQVRLSIANVKNVNGSAYFCPPPPNAEVHGIEEWSAKPIAWQLNDSSGGSLLYLGLNWKHGMREHERMLLALLEKLGLRQQVHCSNPNIWTSVWMGEKKAVCYLINLFTAPAEVSISFASSPNGARFEIPLTTVPPITVLPIEVELDTSFLREVLS